MTFVRPMLTLLVSWLPIWGMGTLLGCSPTTPDKTPDRPQIGDHLCVTGLHLPKAQRPYAAARLLELGARHTRLEFKWHKVEPQPGELRLEQFDDQADAYLEAGIDVIALLDYGNPWASSLTEHEHTFPPDDPEDFGRYVATAVEHFAGRISRFEIWNEPNAGFRFFKPNLKGDPEAFGALLQAAVRAGREVCPNCQFAFGAPFFHSQIIDGHIPFLELVQAAHPDLADHYDAMGLHPYPFYPPRAPPEGGDDENEWAFWEMVEGVREVMARQGAEEKPLWATEMGWPVYDTVTEMVQAAFLVRGMLHLIQEGVSPVCWYNLVNGPDPESFPPESAFGLMTHGDPLGDNPPQPKPAFHALKQLGNRFAKFWIEKDFRTDGSLPDGVMGYELVAGNGERWWVLWTHLLPEPTTVQLPSAVIELRDVVGEPVEHDGGRGVQVDAYPRFARLR